jgi:hypothetical protein
MRTIHLTAMAVLGITLLASSTAWAQPPDDRGADPILREYRSKLPLLMERYSTNRKIRYRLTRYVVHPKAGERIGDDAEKSVNELITDGQQMKVVTTESTTERFKDVDQFWRPDMRFDVTRQGNECKITNQHLASPNYYVHEVQKYSFFCHEPMRSGVSNGTSLWFDDRGKDYVIIAVAEVKPSVWRGRPCVVVRSQWDNRHGMVLFASTYLDPKQDYITIATETDWKTDPLTRKRRKIFDEIEYQPSTEGFPLPAVSHRYIQFEDGSTCKVYDVEFLSYERYVPSREEFRLEGPYKLTTPTVAPHAPIPPLTPPSPPWSVWPWVVLVAGAVLALVTAFLIRRARRESKVAVNPSARPAS